MNLLIVVDHKIILAGVVKLIEDYKIFDNIYSTSFYDTAIEIANQKKIDLLITDLELSQYNSKGKLMKYYFDGIELKNNIKVLQSNIKTIMLTRHDYVHVILRILESNFDGVIFKQNEAEELEIAIRDVLAGENHFCPKVHELMLGALYRNNKTKYIQNANLTKREIEVLKLLSIDKRTDDIAKELFISVETVNSHRKNLLSKFSVKTTGGMISSAFKEGYLF